MPTKEGIGIIPSGVVDARRDEMANAKEFTVQSFRSPRQRGCKPGTCIQPKCPPVCIIPPKCGPGPCKNKL